MADQPLTAGNIIDALIRPRWRRNFVLPNYTPAGWWECDVFEMTEAGFFREYEVKVSRGDFFADANKAKTGWKVEDRRLVQTEGERKHDLLAAGSPKGPCLFWYVTPPGLVRPDELPAWAGLIEMTGRGWAAREQVIRPAPKLHREKVADGVASHARGVCYWRMHDLRFDLIEIGREMKEVTA